VNRLAPLQLPTNLHDLPQGYSQRLKQFHGERGYSAEEHLGWFSDWVDLEEVDHDDVKVILFSQSLTGEARKWFKNLPNASIPHFQGFKNLLKNKWEDKKNPRHYFSQYHSMRRKESVQEFSDRFMKVYSAIPTQFKPPPGSAQLQYAEAFDSEFTLLLCE